MIALTFALLFSADLATIQAEPDPVKRAVKAFDFAFAQLAEARNLSAASEFDKLKDLVPSIADAVEMGERSLTTGKKNPGAIKKAELRCRDLSRRLETLRQGLPFDERGPVELVEKRVHSVEDRLVALVTGKPK